MQFVVRFDRPRGSTGPDAVVVTADSWGESYREGQLIAYQFLDGDGGLVAMVRAAEVTYIAVAGYAVEPALELSFESPPAADADGPTSGDQHRDVYRHVLDGVPDPEQPEPGIARDTDQAR